MAGAFSYEGQENQSFARILVKGEIEHLFAVYEEDL